MRIQETDRILKESRIARNHHATQEHDQGLLSRAMRMVSRITGLFRK